MPGQQIEDEPAAPHPLACGGRASCFAQVRAVRVDAGRLVRARTSDRWVRRGGSAPPRRTSARSRRGRPAPPRRGPSGARAARRISVRCWRVRSEGMLTESAPSRSHTANEAGFTGPTSAETLNVVSAGSTPRARSRCSVHSTPSSATSRQLTPSSAARSASSTQPASASWPRARRPPPPDWLRVDGTGVPGAARPGEQAEFDVPLGTRADHLGDLGVGEHPHAAALADAVDGTSRRAASFSTDAQRFRPLARRGSRCASCRRRGRRAARRRRGRTAGAVLDRGRRAPAHGASRFRSSGCRGGRVGHRGSFAFG